MSTRSEGSQRRAAVVIIGAAFASIAAGTTWERTRRREVAITPLAPAVGDDDTVVARVPPRATDPAARDAERLRAQIRKAPRDLDTAVRLARLDVQAARDGADPRFLGRAEAALAPWWSEASAPPEVVLLRATIRQARHEFDAALVDLDRLVRSGGDGADQTLAPPATQAIQAQALLTRAVILGVKARYDEGLASCARLAGLASPFVRAACRAPLLGLTGRAAGGATELAGVLDQAAGPAEAAWGRAVLADLARSEGDERGAEALLRSVLALAPSDRGARAALCDLLLDAGRADEVAALVRGHEDDDGLLLRLALAEATPGQAREGAGVSARDGAAATVAARFAASRERGDAVHQREESRFALHVERDPARALRLAIANWDVQREPADARALLEAALAANHPASARPALEWLNAIGTAQPRLRALAAALGASSPRTKVDRIETGSAGFGEGSLRPRAAGVARAAGSAS